MGPLAPPVTQVEWDRLHRLPLEVNSTACTACHSSRTGPLVPPATRVEWDRLHRLPLKSNGTACTACY
eukprot:5259651-Pleurochrysis_carterae.AAC.1